MNLLPNKQLLPNVPFQSTKYRKKELGVDNKVRETIGDTFQPIKRLVSTTVKSAKPATMFLIFPLRTKNRRLVCLAPTVHIVLQERRVATTKRKNHLHFEETSPPITT